MERLTITLPEAPALDDARRRIDTIGGRAGRAATACGAAAGLWTLFDPSSAGMLALAAGAVTAAGWASVWLGQPAGHQRATTTALYLMPGVSLCVLLGIERLVPGISWGEVVGVVAWTAATWLLRPARTARRMLTPAPVPAAPLEAMGAVEAVVLDDHPAAVWWRQRVAVSGGAAPGTVLEDVVRTGEDAMTATIRATEAGQPVPEVSIRRLSALMDLPEDLIAVVAVPGRGAGVRQLRVGQDAAAPLDAAQLWAERIAPTAMPGAVITNIRVSSKKS